MELTVLYYLVAALVGGWLASVVRLPPMIGYLGAGFALNAWGVPHESSLDVMANLGVTLLLFAIGLEFDLRVLLAREVWGTALAHMALSVLLTLGLLGPLTLLGGRLLGDETWPSLVLVGFALSFSSTVFALKVLQERSQTQSLYGRIAVGILIVQDLAAVAFLTISYGKLPSPWALTLILLVPGSWLLRRAWDRIGHGEMQVLFGIVVAFVPGYALFDAVGIKGDVGALVMGLLLASHPSANELNRVLFNFKEVFLVGFFLGLGLTVEITFDSVVLAFLLLVLLPLQAALYLLLLRTGGLRSLTAARGSLILMTYSEFGLIVAVVGADIGVLDSEWLGALATTVALSFVLAAVVNGRSQAVVNWLAGRVPDPPHDRLLPTDRPIDIGTAQAVVLGMGRIGQAAYDNLQQGYGLSVVGVENSAGRTKALQGTGRTVLRGDATDADFWDRLTRTDQLQLVVLAMPFHGSNLVALSQLRGRGFGGTVAAITQYDDERADAEKQGAHAVLQLYDGAGAALARRAAESAGLTPRDG